MVCSRIGPRVAKNVGPGARMFLDGGGSGCSWRWNAGQHFQFRKRRRLRNAWLCRRSRHGVVLFCGEGARTTRFGCRARRRRLRDPISCGGRSAEPAGGAARLRSGARTKGVIAATDLHLSHFQAMSLFALLISIAFGFLSRRRTNERVKYIIWSLLLFLLIGVGIGWAMYPFSR